MTKTKLLALFDNSRTKAAKELGVHRQTLWEWPEALPDQAAMRVRDWYVRKGRPVPKAWMPK